MKRIYVICICLEVVHILGEVKSIRTWNMCLAVASASSPPTIFSSSLALIEVMIERPCFVSTIAPES